MLDHLDYEAMLPFQLFAAPILLVPDGGRGESPAPLLRYRVANSWYLVGQATAAPSLSTGGRGTTQEHRRGM